MVAQQSTKHGSPRHEHNIHTNSQEESRTNMVSRFAKDHEEYENGKQIRVCIKPYDSEINLEGTSGDAAH